MPIANIPIIYFLTIIGQMMGGGGYGNMANNGGMNQGMRGANQGGGMNQPWSGQMGNPQGAQMRQQPQQVNKNLRVLSQPIIFLKFTYYKIILIPYRLGVVVAQIIKEVKDIPVANNGVASIDDLN